MGRNHPPECHSDKWTGASGYKVYDPFCPLCQEERHRNSFWISWSDQEYLSTMKEDGGVMNNPIDEVTAERESQKQKGFTAEHDDEHVNGELIEQAISVLSLKHDKWQIFEKNYTNRRRQLIISAALIVAEIERMDRATGSIFQP